MRYALIYAVAILIVLGLALSSCIGIGEASPPNLPTLTISDAEREDRVSIFVDTFLKQDFQGGQLLNPSNLTLYAQGYRPSIGVFHDPEKDGGKDRRS